MFCSVWNFFIGFFLREVCDLEWGYYRSLCNLIRGVFWDVVFFFTEMKRVLEYGVLYFFFYVLIISMKSFIGYIRSGLVCIVYIRFNVCYFFGFRLSKCVFEVVGK